MKRKTSVMTSEPGESAKRMSTIFIAAAAPPWLLMFPEAEQSGSMVLIQWLDGRSQCGRHDSLLILLTSAQADVHCGPLNFLYKGLI